MKTGIPVLLVFLLSCGPAPKPEPSGELPESPLPPTAVASPYDNWMLNEYDIWKFLSANPGEKEVLEILGPPDSSYNDFDLPYRILYYYIPKLHDYNSIEINTDTGLVTGFEWD